jgi:polyvinyl alcohol dehydrogenase (cytochrome)
VLLSFSALVISADGPGPFQWPMIGNDISGTRSQPFEHDIDPHKVSSQEPLWVLTTAGDVSATPAVVSLKLDDRDVHDQRRRSRTTVFFPDWGGRLWSVNGDTGDVIWSRAVADYTGIAGAISRTSPAYADGMIFIGDLNGNMMGVDAETGDLVWLTELDPNPIAIVTTSPVVLGDRLFIATSSSGGGVPRQIFRGSMIALVIHTGEIVCQTFELPDNG